jgi:hypothetical protein
MKLPCDYINYLLCGWACNLILFTCKSNHFEIKSNPDCAAAVNLFDHAILNYFFRQVSVGDSLLTLSPTATAYSLNRPKSFPEIRLEFIKSGREQPFP